MEKPGQGSKEAVQPEAKEKAQTITNIINNNNINNFIINDPSAVADLMQTAAGDSHFHAKKEGAQQPVSSMQASAPDR